MKCIENLINETKREGGTKNFIVEKKPFDDLTIEIKKSVRIQWTVQISVRSLRIPKNRNEKLVI